MNALHKGCNKYEKLKPQCRIMMSRKNAPRAKVPCRMKRVYGVNGRFITTGESCPLEYMNTMWNTDRTKESVLIKFLSTICFSSHAIFLGCAGPAGAPSCWLGLVKRRRKGIIHVSKRWGPCDRVGSESLWMAECLHPHLGWTKDNRSLDYLVRFTEGRLGGQQSFG